MKRKYCLFVLFLFWGALLSGCANLSVRVDILNSAYWTSPQHLNTITIDKIATMEQNILSGKYDACREGLKNEMEKALNEGVKKYPKAISSDELKKMVENGKTSIDKAYNEAEKYFRMAFISISKDGQATSEAITNYREGAKILFSFGRQLINDINKVSKRNPELPDLLPESEKIIQKADSNAAALTGRAGILEDPHAAAVVYAPDGYWTGPRFNETLCRGWFGNTDCAVKMEGLGNFTLKGVKLDASKITQATFTVAGQAVQILGAIYGIPLPKGQTTTAASGKENEGNASPSLPSVEIDSAVKRQSAAETSIVQLRYARLAMIETIVAQYQAVEGMDANKRKKAIETIKSALSVNKKLLDAVSAD